MDLFRVECVRIDIVARPLQHLFVFFMFRVGQNGEQTGIAVRATAIFGRASILTRQATCRAVAVTCNLTFNMDFVNPVVAKVIAIQEFCIGTGNLVQTRAR
jgi:hypothetical protein